MGEEGRERRSCGVWSVVSAVVWRKKRKSSSPKKMGKEKEEKSEKIEERKVGGGCGVGWRARVSRRKKE